MRVPVDRGIHKALHDRALGRRPQGTPRMRYIDNVRNDAFFLGLECGDYGLRSRLKERFGENGGRDLSLVVPAE